MPTTRGTAIKTGSNLDAQTNEHKESASEGRKARFLARKKREAPTNPSPKQRIMIQFLNAILKYIDEVQMLQIISMLIKFL